MALRAYGGPAATLAMMNTNTCSLMFHGPGLRENSNARRCVRGRTIRRIQCGRDVDTSRGGICGSDIWYFLIGRTKARSFPMGKEIRSSRIGTTAGAGKRKLKKVFKALEVSTVIRFGA
jgi:hypothetical protein